MEILQSERSRKLNQQGRRVQASSNEGRVSRDQLGLVLPMYTEPPQGEVSLEEFETFAVERLKVLKTIELWKGSGRTFEEIDAKVSELWAKHMRVKDSPEEEDRKDAVSHFVLRLGYCRSADLQCWFLAQECTLFRHRFKQLTLEGQRRFLEKHNMEYKAISAAELEANRDALEQVWMSIGSPSYSEDKGTKARAPTIYYKVPFEEVPDLVASRSVLLLKGYAFVPHLEFAAIMTQKFRAHLSAALKRTQGRWQQVFHEESHRLGPILEGFSTRYLGEDYADPEARGVGALELAQLDSLAAQSFPMCMRHLFFKLREEHHLRHGGRLQLGLFLKGIGLRLEDAMIFWKTEFGQGVGVERFEKEYAYGIRHNFGKEGKRTDYSPYSCTKIIQSTPGVGDHHGCPFRHFSPDNLEALLHRAGVSAKSIRDVKDKAKQRHYQVACAMVFDATQGQPCPDAGISHPNQYYEWSVRARKGVNLMAAVGGTQD